MTARPLKFDEHFAGPMVFEEPFTTRNSPEGLIVQKVDNAIRRINQYQAESVVCFANTYPAYPLDSDLSG